MQPSIPERPQGIELSDARLSAPVQAEREMAAGMAEILDRDDLTGSSHDTGDTRSKINCRYRQRQTHWFVKLRSETDRLAARLLNGAKTLVGIPMNHSMHSADRATHLKVLVIALISAIVVASLAITTHFVSNASGTTVRHETAITETNRLTSSFPHS